MIEKKSMWIQCLEIEMEVCGQRPDRNRNSGYEVFINLKLDYLAKEARRLKLKIEFEECSLKIEFEECSLKIG